MPCVTSAVLLDVPDTSFSSLSNSAINDTVRDAARRVDLAVDGTRRSLFGPTTGRRDRSSPRTAEDLMRLVRYPPSSAIGLARSAEIFEQTLQRLLGEVNAGYQYDINDTKGKDDLSLCGVTLQLLSVARLRTVYEIPTGCHSSCFCL